VNVETPEIPETEVTPPEAPEPDIGNVEADVLPFTGPRYLTPLTVLGLLLIAIPVLLSMLAKRTTSRSQV